MLQLCIFFVGTLSMFGCAATIEDFKAETPVFNLEDWFCGRFEASGGFFDRFGTLRRRFTMSLQGEKRGEVIVLNEELRYTDGVVQHRTYNIQRVSPGVYEATAEGVVGKARIEAAGNALRWRYTLKEKINDSDWTLTFDDWMFLVDENTLLDRAVVTKFGLTVGEVVLVAKKLSSN